MGTIIPRKRQDGTPGHTAQIRIKRKGVLMHSEAQTFDRKRAATAWLKKREAELAEPGALELVKAADPPLSEAIDRYTRESLKAIGRTKARVLRGINRHAIGSKPCSAVTSENIVGLGRERVIGAAAVQPQTAAGGERLVREAVISTSYGHAASRWNFRPRESPRRSDRHRKLAPSADGHREPHQLRRVATRLWHDARL